MADDANNLNEGRKIATALKYDTSHDRAPKVVAKGMGLIADNILKKAEEHDIPVYEDETLANQLYNLSLGEEIPPEMYNVVAEVLVFIAKMDTQAKLKKRV